MTAGVTYIWETRDLSGGSRPDTYMYLTRGESIVAKNDDFNGRASLIAYVPSVSGTYYLIIRAYSWYKRGFCDVYESVGGGGAIKIDNDVLFTGWPVSAHWKADESIETRNATGDTYLYLIHGNTMLRDDDGGSGLHSRIKPGYEGWGLVVVGSYSRWTQGTTQLCNYYQSYFDNPGGRDEIDDPNIVVSEAMERFQAELRKQKASLEGLSDQEREAAIRVLRDKMLSPEDVRQMDTPEIHAPENLIAADQRYDELLRAEEQRLAGLSLESRAVEMARIEREKREIFRDIVPQEEESSAPG